MTESIFGAEVPAVTNVSDAVDYSLGVQFVPAVSGSATHGKFYFPTTAQNNVVIGIFRVAGAVTLGTKAFPNGTATGWQTVAFDTPIALTAAEAYRVAVWIPTHYNYTASYPWPKAGTGGNLTASSPNGYFLASTGSLVMPTTASGNSASYFADLIFEPAGGGGGVTPAGLSIPIALGTPTVTLNRTAAPSGLSIPVGLGTPGVGAGLTPSGLSIPVSLGTPSTAGTVLDPVQAGGSWYGLLTSAQENRAYAREEARASETECPNDGEPLLRNPRTGKMQCPYDGYVARR